MDVLDRTGIDDAQYELSEELTYIFNKTDIFPGRILIVGLGNPTLAPDSIGCECAKRIRPTLHISEFDRPFFESLACSEIAICTPGVNATSGLDALVTVKALTKELKPDAVIAIDALASSSVERLGSTVQISNTGICPGSGLGNSRSKIDEESVGVPVIAIGVPTVIDSRVFSINSNSDKAPVPAMIVSPKEINDIVSAAAEIISGGINQAFGICI
jgi:spore protease